ncbi:hypothetical protein JCM30760_00300 [Thiomicrorhabdus hydrogeniphila]
MLTINRFLSILFLLTVSALYGSFIIYYIDEQKTKASMINEDFNRVLHETAYTITTELNNLNNINNFRALLDRKVVQNPLISALAIFKGQTPIISTDPDIRQPPNNTQDHIANSQPVLEAILNNKVHQLNFEIYPQNQTVKLNIYLFANQAKIESYFSNALEKYVMYFIIPTLLISLILYWLLQALLVKPLEKLKFFAYYHNKVPDPLKIKELESIRSSMLQTFQLLTKETKALYHSARTDALSELPNRFQLNERLTWLIKESERENKDFAYLFLDIDNFKKINDTLGHDAGDEIVINVSKIMLAELRGYDIIARVGGDEFVIIINKYQNHIELSHIIERVLSSVSQDQFVRNQLINISASIGVAFYPKDGTNGQELMKNADIAMYEAKKLGKNQYHYFTEALNHKILAEVSLEAELRQALQNQEFELYYQPKVSTKDSTIIGLECLVRWNHPTKGVIPPFDFIPTAELSGLILPLGDWILQEALEHQLEWNKKYNIQLPVSVNVSALQFSHKNFFSKLQTLLHNLNFPAHCLDIEITESVLMKNTEQHLNTLKKIRGLGSTVSLDDFGTGYSSLAYLKTFPINILKIDKSFMVDFETTSGAIFIETIVNMAHNLKIDVIAEGVETQAQLDFLKSVQCESYQGYFCSKPVPEKEFLKLVQNKCSNETS